MNHLDYWKECVALGAEDIGPAMTDEQLTEIAASVMGGHENYGMAFYSPPSGDRLHAIESEWKAKYAALERDFESYKANAETAVKRALRQYDDTIVSIHEGGEVLRHGGRTERIQ